MGGGGSKGGTTTVEKADPWSGQQPYLVDIFGQAQALNQQGLAGGAPLYAPFSQQTESALQMGENRALAGSPLTNQAQANLMDIMTGGAGWDALASPLTRKFSEITMPGIAANAAASGRYGSNAMGVQQSQARSDLAEGLGRLGLQTAAMAPQLAAQDYADIAELSNIGATREAQAQRQLDEPYSRLARYQQYIQGMPVAGGTSTNTSYRPSAGLNIGGGLGGGMLGYAAGSAIGMPWLGAVLGGAGGLFG